MPNLSRNLTSPCGMLRVVWQVPYSRVKPRVGFSLLDLWMFHDGRDLWGFPSLGDAEGRFVAGLGRVRCLFLSGPFEEPEF